MAKAKLIQLTVTEAARLSQLLNKHFPKNQFRVNRNPASIEISNEAGSSSYLELDGAGLVYFTSGL